jgi:putative transposase
MSSKNTKELDGDCRLIKTREKKFYLCLVVKKAIVKRPENQRAFHPRVLSLDPGVRTFMTGYDPSGYVFEWGKNDMQCLYRLGLHMDTLISRCDAKETKHRKRYTLRKAIGRLRIRIKNLVSEVHRKMAKWIVQNFTLVLIPAFGVSNMVQKTNSKGQKRKIRSKTVRQMLTWSHYRFRQLLLSKAEEYPQCQVKVVEEPYTSKTCSNCGYIHQKLGSSKVFKCPRCCMEMDRDFNGARNIWLRWLTLEEERVGGVFQ